MYHSMFNRRSDAEKEGTDSDLTARTGAEKSTSIATSIGLPVLTIVIAAAIFVGDILTPQDAKISLFFVVVVVLSAQFCDDRQVVFVGIGCIALTVPGHFFSPPPVSQFAGNANFIIAILAIALTTFLTVKDKTRERARNEIRRLNEALEKRAAELEASNKELEAFSYSVAHDLRAPLRHIAAYSEMLQKKAAQLDDTGQRYTRTILESAKKMGNLIDDLLAFSRIGRVEAHMTLVNLEQLVREVVTEASQDAKGRNISWKIDSLPVCYGDRSMLRLALLNLISNATKFTRERERAEIEIGATNGNANEIEVYVKDNGAGFDMRYVNKLFGVFERLHSGEVFEGTGIGLATVRRIIRRHGGDVRAEGQVGHGAIFHFSLPRIQNGAKGKGNS